MESSRCPRHILQQWCVFNYFQQRLERGSCFQGCDKRALQKAVGSQTVRHVEKVLKGWCIMLQACSLPYHQYVPPPKRMPWMLKLVYTPISSWKFYHRGICSDSPTSWIRPWVYSLFAFRLLIKKRKKNVRSSLVFSLLTCQLHEVTLFPQGDFLLVPLPSVNRALMLLGVKKASHWGQTSERCKRPNVRLPIKQQGGKFLTLFWLKWVGWGKKLN